MNELIGTAVKTPDEVKRYRVDYTDWLDDGEMVLTVGCSANGDGSAPTFPSTVIDPDGLGVAFFIAGGDDQITYEVVVEITTNAGQVKQDAIQLIVSAL